MRCNAPNDFGENAENLITFGAFSFSRKSSCASSATCASMDERPMEFTGNTHAIHRTYVLYSPDTCTLFAGLVGREVLRNAEKEKLYPKQPLKSVATPLTILSKCGNIRTSGPFGNPRAPRQSPRASSATFEDVADRPLEFARNMYTPPSKTRQRHLSGMYSCKWQNMGNAFKIVFMMWRNASIDFGKCGNPRTFGTFRVPPKSSDGGRR